jgi:hypothetical protein
MSRASDIAGACVYLASDDAEFVTGVVLPIDGGSGVPPPALAQPPGSEPAGLRAADQGGRQADMIAQYRVGSKQCRLTQGTVAVLGGR